MDRVFYRLGPLEPALLPEELPPKEPPPPKELPPPKLPDDERDDEPKLPIEPLRGEAELRGVDTVPLLLVELLLLLRTLVLALVLVLVVVVLYVGRVLLRVVLLYDGE